MWLFGKMFRQVLSSYTQPQIWSIHVVVRTKTAKKYTKMHNTRAGYAELLFLLIKPIVLWRSLSRRRFPCVSSLMLRERGQIRTISCNIQNVARKKMTVFKFDPTSTNMFQQIAAGCPIMLPDIALKCCERLARPLAICEELIT